MSLVFLDTETFGLEFHHDIWEIAWAVDDGPIRSEVVPHDARNADPKALELNGYLERGLRSGVSLLADLHLRNDLAGNTMVAANPTFDATRLQLRWGCAPWHYRVVDVSAMSIPVLGFDEYGKVRGLWSIANELRDGFGLDIPEPDHSAAADVATLRAVYHGLLSVSAGSIGRLP